MESRERPSVVTWLRLSLLLLTCLLPTCSQSRINTSSPRLQDRFILTWFRSTSLMNNKIKCIFRIYFSVALVFQLFFLLPLFQTAPLGDHYSTSAAFISTSDFSYYKHSYDVFMSLFSGLYPPAPPTHSCRSSARSSNRLRPDETLTRPELLPPNFTLTLVKKRCSFLTFPFWSSARVV